MGRGLSAATTIQNASFPIFCPRPRVDAAMAVGHHKHATRSSQSQRKGGTAGSQQQQANIEVLRVGQHATPAVTCPGRPGVKHFGKELEDTLLPQVADEQVTLQPVWVHHQCPADLARTVCHRHDVLPVHGVDTGSKQLVRAVEVVGTVVRRANFTLLDCLQHFSAQVLQVCASDAPAVRRDGLVQLHGLLCRVYACCAPGQLR